MDREHCVVVVVVAAVVVVVVVVIFVIVVNDDHVLNYINEYTSCVFSFRTRI